MEIIITIIIIERKKSMKIFDNENYKFISELVESKIPILRQNKKFEEKYLRLSNAVEELENELSENQKQQFDEIIKLMHETEQYYFALSYSLGVKYGEELKEI